MRVLTVPAKQMSVDFRNAHPPMTRSEHAAMTGIPARPAGSSGKTLHQIREQAERAPPSFFAVHESL
jgi:hypothetical protein